MKKEIRTDSTWMKIKISGALIDYLYGPRDGTDYHGHTITSGGVLIYERNVSGMKLMGSGANLNLTVT